MGIVNLLTKTNLDFLRKLKYIFITSKSYEGSIINFWCKASSEIGYVQKMIFGISEDNPGQNIKILIDRVLQNIQFSENYQKKFKYVDIIFFVNSEKIEPSKVLGTQFIRLGYVEAKDADTDRNIINLGLSEIELLAINKYNIKKINFLKQQQYTEEDAIAIVSQENKEIKLKTENTFVNTLSSILSHELTHLWHVKQSQANDMRDRMQNLFLSRITPGKEDNPKVYSKVADDIFKKIFTAECTYEEFNTLIEILKKFYLIIRMQIEDFSYLLAMEGMANFMGDYISEKYNYDEYIATAEKKTNELVLDFEKMQEAFKNHVEFLMKISEENLLSKKISILEYAMEAELSTKLKEKTNYQFISDFLENIKKNYPYTIGPVIPATLYEYGMQINEIGLLNPHELISKYEEICVSKGIRPVISNSILSKSNAVFNSAEAAATFNALRKKLGITSLPQK